MTVDLDALVTTGMAARLLAVPAPTVRTWARRYPDAMPVRGRLGNRPLYRYRDVATVEAATRRSPNSHRS